MIILTFVPVSVAHFNPAVTIVFWMRREIGTQVPGAAIAVLVFGWLLRETNDDG